MTGSLRRLFALTLTCALGCAPARPGPAPSNPGSVVSEGTPDPAVPARWVAELADPASSSDTMRKLEQRFEDALTKAGGRRDDPGVVAVVGDMVAPLTTTYVEHYGELDVRTRVRLIRLLADLRDSRTGPALDKAFAEFSRQPTGDKEQSDVKWAARAVAELGLASPGPLLRAFAALRASSMLGGITYRDMNDAMVRRRDKSWTKPLIVMLSPRIVVPRSAGDRAAIDAYRDQLFWQTTAAQVLGELRAREAVEPLLSILLDPTKADVQQTAVLALVKIGKPAEEQTIRLLEGPDEQVRVAALVLGAIGRRDAVAPMIEAAKKAGNDVSRTVIARELTKLPPNRASLVAFEMAFDAVPASTRVPPGQDARSMLVESAAAFFDPALIDWLIQRGERAKGDAEDVRNLRTTIAVVVTKLAKPEQMAKAKNVTDKWGTKLEKDLFAQARRVVDQCGAKASCYVGAMRANQQPENRFAGIKAGAMAAIFGNASTRDGLVRSLDELTNPALRFVAAQAIDHLSPDGSPAAAAKIRDLIERDASTLDPERMLADAPLKQLVYRLEARARPR